VHLLLRLLSEHCAFTGIINFIGNAEERIIEDPKATAPILSYLFHRIEVEKLTKDYLTAIVVDEAWFAMENESFRLKFNDWLRTLAKLNAFITFATQSLDEISKSEITPAIVDGCKTKILLERQEKETNYLIYAPFKRSENRENHLADTIMYSKVFLTDWISIMAQNLQINDELKGVMEEHRKFFEAKDRREKFEKLLNDSKPSKKEDMEIILMRAITGSKAEIFDGFEDITRILITDANRKESKYLAEFRKYNLEEIIKSAWKWEQNRKY